MPTPKDLDPLEIFFSRGFWPSAPDIPPSEFLGTIKAGSNVWIRSTGKPEVAKGLLQTSSTNVGARIFAADIGRATIAGALVGSLLPYAGLIRFDNSVLIFLSQETSATVFLDETSASITTSATAGRLRIAIPDGAGGYDDFDAGFDKPDLTAANVNVFTVASGLSGSKPMAGAIGVAIAPWRIKSDAIGPPSEIVYNNVAASSFPLIRIGSTLNLPTPQSGQDGWIYCGTRWDDRSGELHVVRYIRITARGTVTVTNGSTAVTGSGTVFTEDLNRGDIVRIDGNDVQLEEINSDTSLTLTGNYAGANSSGEAVTMLAPAASWYDAELGALISHEVNKPPRAAGVLKYAGRVLLFGVPDITGVPSSLATGPALVPMLPNNPEHCDLTQAIATQSGSDIVNALGVDGPLYLMTTTGLEMISFTSDPDEPYKIKIIAEPGFKAATNGVLDGDDFYGWNGQPFRTRASENIDTEFAEPVREIMEDWDGARVMLAVDPINRAVLFMYDNTSTTIVLPWMTQFNIWGPELNFSARIIDSAVVNGALYVTYLSGGNYRVNQWEGGTGIGGTRFVASQYNDSRLLARNRVKRLAFAGKAGTLRVYAATEDAAIPDVTDTGAAAASFTLSDVDKLEPVISTNIHGNAFAFRVDFSSNDGKMTKLVVSGTPIGR